MAAALLAGCTRQERFPSTAFQEGIPTRVSIQYESEVSIVETRADSGPNYENRIDNIYLFVFNSSGDRQALLENEDGDLRTSKGLITPNDGLYRTDIGIGRIEFICPSMTDASIVAIANVTAGSTTTAYAVDEEMLDKIETLEELKGKIMKMDDYSVGRGAQFMMTGYAVKEEGQTQSTSIDITGSPSGTVELENCSLQLNRADAKVEVIVKSAVPDGVHWSDYSFMPKSWKVVNVPAQSLILPDENGGDADGEYFDTIEDEFEELTRNVENEGNSTSRMDGSFVFYMPENLKTPENPIDNSSALSKEEKYALRELWVTEGGKSDPSKPGYNEDNIGFRHAPENSTYLEITGQISYYDEDAQRKVSADTRYFVHLGNGVDDPNDYKTKRNHHYIYNITVQGVHDVTVEVLDLDEPDRPGHEGNTVYNGNQSGYIDLDSHYDRCKITLSRAALLNQAGGGVIRWGVSTPFSAGIHEVGTEIPENMRDYRWIKFAVNAEYGVASDEMVKYPGDQNYNDPFPQQGWVQGRDYDAPSPYEGYAAYGTARLRDVDQLLRFLKAEAADADSEIFDSNGDVAVTVFVDEYLYVRNPLKTSPEKDLTLWKSSVNQQDRMLHIIVDDARYSADGNSSVVSSEYTFNQRAIRSIYNVNADDLPSAWGLESVMESERLPVDEQMPSEADDHQNGRYNTWQYILHKHGERQLKWTDVLNTDEGGQYELNRDYNNYMYACLIRNRDLNGDNIVDRDEIRWYIASINQLTDIFIGEFALDYESRLYPYDPVDPVNGIYPPGGSGNNIFWHYASSTYEGHVISYDSPWGSWWDEYVDIPVVVWAEEGPSKGNYMASKRDNGENYAYRCVRNLGIDIGNIEETPVDFAQVVPGTRIIDLSWLDPKALRAYPVSGDGMFIEHDEKSEHSLPRKRFEVSDSYAGNGSNWVTYQTSNPFRDQDFRLPTLRELILFTSRLPIPEITGHGGSYHIMSNTSFSMNGHFDYGYNRNGYSYNTKDGSMGPANNPGYVYGVKDLE